MYEYIDILMSVGKLDKVEKQVTISKIRRQTHTKDFIDNECSQICRLPQTNNPLQLPTNSQQHEL